MPSSAALLCILVAAGCASCQRGKADVQGSPRATPIKSDESARDLAVREHLTPDEPPASSSPAPNDKGIFSYLDDRIELQCAPWLLPGPLLQVAHPGSTTTWLSADGVVICETKGSNEVTKGARTERTYIQDRDHDGIFDAVDVLRGAKKAVANGASYKNTYHELDFPGGDVPRTEGVCTDVIIRALRNAGYDLQELVANDIKTRPAAYPMVKKPDPNIDHRRVRTLLPYFQYAFTHLPASHTDSAFPYLPGDVVFMDTLGDREPEHLGIVSDKLGKSGYPLLINNWTVGTVTREMDLLGKYRVTHRFRVARPTELEPKHKGLEGVLLRQNVTLPPESEQVILVTTPLWSSSGGTLTRFAREGEAPFSKVGKPRPVRIGSAGLGEGRGLHGSALTAKTVKQEGDKCAPSGVFSLGTAFGRPPKAPYQGARWPYRAVNARDFWIDDPKSPDYNRWVTMPGTEAPTWSAEKLTMYSLGLVVEHNTSETIAGRGSAIFLHPWKDEHTPTVGCTAIAQRDLEEILAWLDQAKSPVLVQVADRIYD